MMRKAAAPEKNRKASVDSTMLRFRKWNMWLAGLYVLQGCAIVLAGSASLVPVQTSYLTADPVASELAGEPVLGNATRHLLDINLVYLVAAFFFIAAIAHAVAATIYRKRYESDLKKGVNKVRWVEYAVSTGTMLVGIALLSGISDLASLKMIFILGLITSAMGLVMEVVNQGRAKILWLPYAIGCLAGVTPWGVFALYAWNAGLYGGDVPAFIYWIYGTMFLLFSAFAVATYLYYKKVGKWKEYMYGERAYMILGLVAKTALAWQIFVGTLRS